MPILKHEPDMFPDDLLQTGLGEEERWWAIYTLSRQEKLLMRKLREAGIAHYGPLISRRYRSPAGRVRTTYMPLFANYVFVRGTEEDRYNAVCTGCVSRYVPVADSEELVTDLAQVRRLIETGAPLAPEERLEPGDIVRVKTGSFAGFEGRILDRSGERRLVVEVRFMNQGASVKLEDCQLERIGRVEQ